MRTRRFSVAWLAFLWVLGSTWLMAQEPVVSEAGYWRQYYRFRVPHVSAALLKSDMPAIEKALGPQRTQQLKTVAEEQMKKEGANPAQGDWRDYVTLANGGMREFTPTPAPVPPDDWTSPDFDDSVWVRERGLFQCGPKPTITMPVLGQYDESVDLRLQSGFYRTRFVVDDPAKAAGLTLSADYTGGLLVFVNGKELARQHLPAGALAPDTPAEDYPPAAYAAGGAHVRTTGNLELPAAMLRPGVNVLALEVRASLVNPVVLTNKIQDNWGGPQRPWPHANISRVALTAAPGAIASALKRPAGFQAWVEDMHHRPLSSDFLAPGEKPGAVRIVAARNGSYSALIVLGTDKVTPAPSVEVGPLTNGATVLATSVTIHNMQPFPVAKWTLAELGEERGLKATFPDMAQLAQYATRAAGGGEMLFDQITEDAPPVIPADSARPIWLTVKTPKDAAAGTYKGTATIRAAGVDAIQIPVEVEVADWTLPDPKDFQTFVGCEENPYGVAKQYGVALWSPEHFKFLESSFAQMARVGGDWLNVPVIARTEFGNQFDSMIRWTVKTDGSLAFDFTILDRYLDLAVKSLGTRRVIQFVVEPGMKSAVNPPAPFVVQATDEKTGQPVQIPLGGAGGLDPAQTTTWKTFAAALYDHMKSKGLEKTMFWGAPLETEAEPALKTVLASAVPDVYWTAGGHEIMFNAKYCQNEQFYKIITDIRYQGGWHSFRTDEGWKSPTLHLANPRVGGTCLSVHTSSYPFAYRELSDRALAMGRSGFGRVGVDEWAGIHHDGMVVSQWQTGVPILFTLWPGRNGAESSARFEALLEGIQETEARIFLEQSLDKGGVPQAADVKKVLDARTHETDFFQGNSLIYSMEKYSEGWLDRSKRLYDAAAQVAKQEKR